MTLVTDTHALIWHLTEPKRLGKRARRAFAEADAGKRLCHVPAAVFLETWLLHERGRLRITPAQVLDVIAGHPGYALLPLDTEQVVEFGAWPSVRDPVDRVIVAAACVTRSKLISADTAFEGLPIVVIWD
jgi:PIN domain nuclease of toxin-antitoxin system